MRSRVMTVILAGGKGARLEPLTRDRAKPAVPFGGAYRIIDFSLSNCLNSGLRQILVLTQYKAMSLDRHIVVGWSQRFCRELDEFVEIVPPQQWIDDHWYQGTADAVYQNIRFIERERPEYVVILAGDHIYKMDYQAMLARHITSRADLSIAAIPTPIDLARGQLGVLEINSDRRVIGFEEKPDNPKPSPGRTDQCLASMGVYVFSARFLFEELCRDATRKPSRHDFGHDIIPEVIEQNRIFAYPFEGKTKGEAAYWRDVGTIDAYYEANMDLIAANPRLDMYDPAWPIRTYQTICPPPKFVHNENGRRGMAIDSIVSQGAVVSGAAIERSILGVQTRVNSYASIEDSLLFSRVEVGRYAKIRRAIIDKDVKIPPGIKIGYDHELDRARGFEVTPSGITVIAKSDGFEEFPEEIPSPPPPHERLS